MAKILYCSECGEPLGKDEPNPHFDRCVATDDIDRACNKWWREVGSEGICYNASRRKIWRAAVEWAKLIQGEL